MKAVASLADWHTVTPETVTADEAFRSAVKRVIQQCGADKKAVDTTLDPTDREINPTDEEINAALARGEELTSELFETLETEAHPPLVIYSMWHELTRVLTARGWSLKELAADAAEGVEIDDMDVFDSMRGLLHDDIDLDNRAAVERALINPYKDTPASKRFIDWCTRAAKHNKARGGLLQHEFGEAGAVPAEHGPAAESA